MNSSTTEDFKGGMSGDSAVEVSSTASFGELVSSYSSFINLDDASSKKFFDGRIGVALRSLFNESFYISLCNSVHGVRTGPIGQHSRRIWSDRAMGEQRDDYELSSAMVPAGRAAKAAFPYMYYLGKWDNTRLGEYGLKAQASIDAERQTFDAGFQRATRRDIGQIHVTAYGLVAKRSQNFLAYTLELYCTAYIGRAVQRNLLSRNCGTHLTELGAAANDVADDWLRVDPGHAVPGGADRSRIRIITAEMYTEEYWMNLLNVAPPERVWVSRASGVRPVFSAIAMLWVASLDEVGILGDGDTGYLVLPRVADRELTNIFQTVGLHYVRGGHFNAARIMHWVKYHWSIDIVRDFDVFTEGDNQRLVQMVAYERFRYQTGADAWGRLNQFDSVAGRVSIPLANQAVRVCGALGILESVEGMSQPLHWAEIETQAWERGVVMGATGDIVMQRVCGHWANLGHMQGRFLLQEALSHFVNAFVHGMGANGVVYHSGVTVEIPVVDQNDVRAPVGYRRTWPVAVTSNQRGLDRRDDDGIAENVVLAPRADEYGYLHEVLGANNMGAQRGAPTASPHVWLVMTRAEWVPAVPDFCGTFVAVPDVTFRLNARTSAGGEVLMSEPSAYLESAFSRGVIRGDLFIELKNRPTVGARQSLRVQRSWGGGRYATFVWWSAEVGRTIGYGLSTHNAPIKQLEFVRDFSFYGGGSTPSPANTLVEQECF